MLACREQLYNKHMSNSGTLLNFDAGGKMISFLCEIPLLMIQVVLTSILENT